MSKLLNRAAPAILVLMFGCAGSAASSRADRRAQPAGEALQASAARNEEAAPVSATKEMLVVNGQVHLTTDDVRRLVKEIRAEVSGRGGVVVNDRLNESSGDRPRAELRLRLPTGQISPLLDWLEGRAHIESRTVAMEDVSRDFVDRELAIKSLEVTSSRLQRLIEERTGSLAEVLQIESELTRVRRELEQLKGAQRQLGDRVARATLDLTIGSRESLLAPLPPVEKFQLMGSGVLLGYADRRGRSVQRGGGVTLLFQRGFAVELQLFPPTDDGPRSVMLNVSTAVYSNLLGGGRRRFLNPYVGLVSGAGAIAGRGVFSIGASAGVELYRGRWALVEAQTRALGFFWKGEAANDLALQALFNVGIPF